MKQKRNIKQIIVHYVTLLSVSLGIVLTLIMIITSVSSTASVLLDSLGITARTSSQNVSSNLHLLADRMDSLAQDKDLKDPVVPNVTKQQVLKEHKKRIEFVWIAAYDMSGKKIYGDDTAPGSVTDQSYYENLVDTKNITIGEPYYQEKTWQLCVGIPVINSDKQTEYYLIGSYKYDLLNDVLSNINIGAGGSAYILNQEGDIIANKDMSAMEKQENIYELYGSWKNNKIFDSMLNFQTDAVSVFFQFKQHYMAYSPIAGTNWTLMIAAPGVDFMGILFTSVIISIILIVVLQLASRKVVVKMAEQISGSLSLATDRLSSLSAGNLKDEVVFADSNEEAEILTTALAKTISNLAVYIDDITSYL